MPERFMEEGDGGGEGEGRDVGVVGKVLNYAFRRDGGMPWGALWPGWNKQVELGVGKGVKVEGWEISIALGRKGVHGGGHAEPGGSVGDGMGERRLGALWRERKAEMEGFWFGREGR
ncbi:glycosyltransferase family 8 protein [Glonium stellatum]|uniref:Glycosyltransferase family 8 protein n=1 Tax=Glonium stellatum TaxID=574774 RepID=A0A8E2F0L3_9PEZI|nr:glycosyltransferase family 8 protein [Glonium stellatum]